MAGLYARLLSPSPLISPPNKTLCQSSHAPSYLDNYSMQSWQLNDSCDLKIFAFCKMIGQFYAMASVQWVKETKKGHFRNDVWLHQNCDVQHYTLTGSINLKTG